MTSAACHPERGEAESKDPAILFFGYATGSLDFTRNDAMHHFSCEFRSIGTKRTGNVALSFS
jgi:hypothetical protein